MTPKNVVPRGRIGKFPFIEQGDDADDDCRFWLRVPVAKRVAATWELSVELYALAARNGGVFDESSSTWMEAGDLVGQRPVDRSIFRVTRR